MNLALKIIGAKEVAKYLRRSSRKLEDRRPAYRQVSVYLQKAQNDKLTNSRGRRGTLADVEKWTRKIAGKNENSRVLLRTGQLRRSFNPLSITRDRLVFGPRSGAEREKALDMTLGREGKIKVAAKKIRTAQKSGNQYVRIRSNDGQWYTKIVEGGFVSVQPQAREFIFTDRSDARQILAILRRHVIKATA